MTYGMCCHALFIFGVGAMMVEMAFGMSRCWGTLPPPLRDITNGALLLQFPAVHSLLLSRPGRRFLGRLAPFDLGAQLSTTTYAAIASIQVGLLFLLWTPSGSVWWRAAGPSLVATGLLYAAAWLLLLKSIVDAGFPLQVGLLGWWAVARGRKPVYPPMPRRGLFRLCRQPIYVAFALTLWTRAGMDSGPALGRDRFDDLLRARAAAEGSPIPARIWDRVRPLPAPCPVLAALAATVPFGRAEAPILRRAPSPTLRRSRPPPARGRAARMRSRRWSRARSKPRLRRSPGPARPS